MSETNSFMVCGSRFDISVNYALIKPIGQGAYGIVCAAKDVTDGNKVAIKKVGKVFDHETDAKRTLREVKILRHFDHENIIALYDLMPPPSREAFEDLYMVTELMDTDLHQIIGSNQPLSEEHAQYFVYQILRGLKYIHSAHVLHRDLKPSNLLVNANCDLKICDFGLARVADPDENHAGFMTEYVATRWYRAPEIMLSWKQYTKAVDLWSVGCIFAELLQRRPLLPGRDYIDQITKIIDLLGTPSEDDIAAIQSDKARRYVKSLPHRELIPFAQQFPDASPEALDLLQGLLTFNPAKRLTVEEALAHPYLAALHDPDDEPSAEAIFDFAFEREQLNKERLRDLLFEEICAHHPEIAEGQSANGMATMDME
ncbi:CMGC/MAPK protein kinase [Thecamonas trahens ATCC 50062]|uniref:Mitogen-activated protein kinase n=1 Tax=Thecamonas trahens ATCC 50062 TaxID=461836 RepID=A0A0L0DLW0_THETB|nr:CMGC/MAPK protein kinase [Thecamonas trahens ATCC 50062]KNC53240.1 CMGC/MAPK protein kinase [Thecamonas trahens ATCC 50062]|eukprot:XP_013754506.1 CMGC/MAPK protein kinase [Thecamonas trahens ATCC 50062]